jgi:hypothetical protein
MVSHPQPLNFRKSWHPGRIMHPHRFGRFKQKKWVSAHGGLVSSEKESRSSCKEVQRNTIF